MKLHWKKLLKKLIKKLKFPEQNDVMYAVVQVRLQGHQQEFVQDAAALDRFRFSIEVALRVVQVTTCPQCKGKGKLIETPCNNCHGSGLVKKAEKSLSYSRRHRSGKTNCARGEGDITSSDGEPGDLYVIVHVKHHQQFIREAEDLWYIAMITFPQAALGADITVPRLKDP